MSKKQGFVRFRLSDRFQHLVLMLSFTILGITGLPQKYSDAGLSVALIRLFGGIEQTRVIHHTAAVALIMVSIYHVVSAGYRIYVMRQGLPMLPGLNDFTDFIQAIQYNLGLSNEHPHYGRFNFIEKLEYWAVVWGTVLMTITGYLLWNPVIATRFFPGEWIPAAKAAHGLEALLAILAIVTWHSYFVHFPRFNKAIFTGVLGKKEMKEEHGQELEQHLAGRLRPEPAREIRWRRLLAYMPFATIFVIVSVAGTWWFLTAEQTAITTVPRIAAEEKVYQPVALEKLETVAERAEQQVEVPLVYPMPSKEPTPIISHGVGDEMSGCNLCHDINSLIAPAPLSHRDFAEGDCLTCHQVAGGEQ